MDRLRSSTAMRIVLAVSLILPPITGAAAQESPVQTAATQNTGIRSTPPITIRNGQQTLLNVTPTGTPIVEIATPDKNGTSYNAFERFNVYQEGTILNNSAEIENSLLGGQLLANRNFKREGREADLIIAEVLGGSRSDLFGPLEVFGGDAGLVIANSAGITCDGCGFIGTPRVTLSTGQVQFGADGRFSGLSVTKGDVAISGQGLFGGNVDYFDIVSLTTKINADLYTRDLLIAAGSGKFDYARRLTESRGKAGTGVAIDSTLLGGMYANRIRLIGNDLGVGINLQGSVASLTGDIDVEARGAITIRDIAAAGDLNVGSSAASVNITDRAYAAGAVNLTAGENIALSGQFVGAASDVVLKAGRDIAVTDADIYAGLRESGTLTGSGRLALTADGASNFSNATLLASEDANIAADMLSLNAGTKLAGQQVDIVAASAALGGEITSLKDLNIDAGSLNASARLTANDRLKIAANVAAITGNATGLNAASLDIANAFEVGSAGSIETNGVLQLEAGSLKNAGRMAAVAGAAINVDNSAQVSGSILSANNISLNISGATDIAGTISAGQNLVIDSAEDLAISGTIAANKRVSLTGREFNLTGSVSAGTDAMILAANIAANGQVAANGALTLQSAKNIIAGGELLAGGQLALSANDRLLLAGDTQAAGLTILTAQHIALDGMLVSDGGVAVNATTAIDVSGILQSISDIGFVSAGSLNLSDKAQIATSGLLNVAAENIALAGRVSAAGNANVVAVDSIVNSALVTSGGNVQLTAHRIETSGAINSGAKARLLADSVNIDGRLSGGTGLFVDASSITTGAFADIQSGGDLSIAADQSLYLAGSSLSVGASRFTAGEDLTFNVAALAGGNINLLAAGLVTGAGSAASNGAITVAGAELNSDLALSAAGNLSLFSRAAGLRQSGELLSESLVDISSADNLLLSGELSSGGMTLLSGQNITVDGKIKSVGDILSRAVGDSFLRGNITANGNVDISAHAISNDAALLTQGAILFDSQSLLSNRGSLNAIGDIQLRSGGLLSQSGDIESAADIVILAGSNLDLSGHILANDILVRGLAIQSAGNLQAQNDIHIDAAQDLQLSGASVTLALQALRLQSGSKISNAGVMNGNLLTLTATDIENIGTIEARGAADISAQKILANRSSIASLGNINLAATEIISTGKLQSSGDVTILAGDLANLTSLISSNGAITIAANALKIGEAAEILSNDGIGLQSATFADIAGKIQSLGDISLTASRISSAANIGSGANILLNQTGAGANLAVSGIISADDNVQLMGANIFIDGKITGKSGASVVAQNLTTTVDSLLESGDTLDLSSSEAANLGGKILSLGKLTATSGSDLLVSGKWEVGGNVDILAANALDISGDLFSAANIAVDGATVDVSGALQADQNIMARANIGDLALGGMLLAQQDIGIAAGAADILVGGSALSNGHLNIDGNNIVVSGSVQSIGELGLAATGALTFANGAIIESNNIVNLTATRLQSGANIFGEQALAINIVGDANIAGLIQSRGAISIDAGNIEISAVAKSLGDIVLNAEGSLLFANASTLSSSGMTALTAGADIIGSGQIAAIGNIAIGAGGLLQTTGALTSGAAINIAANDALIADLSAVEQINISAIGKLDLLGGVSSDGNIGLSANDIAISETAGLSVAGTLTGNASGAFVNAGTLAASGNFNINAGGDYSHSGSLTTDGSIFLESHATISATGTVEAMGLIEITAAEANFANRVIGLEGVLINATNINVGDAATIESGENLSINAANSLIVSGSLLALADMNLRANALLDFSGKAEAGGDAALNADQRLEFSGSLRSDGAAKLTAPNLIMTGGEITTDDILAISGAGDLNLSTNLASRTEVNVKAVGNLNLTGNLISNDKLFVSAQNIDVASTISALSSAQVIAADNLTLATSAIVASGGLVTLDSGQIFANDGLVSSSDLTIAAQNISNTGRIEASGTAELAATAILNNANILVSSGALQLSGNNVILGGEAFSDGDLNIDAVQAISLTGELSAVEEIGLTAQDIVLNSGSTLVSDNDVSLNSDVAISADGTIFTLGNLIVSGGDLSIAGTAQAIGLVKIDTSNLNVGGALFSDLGIGVDVGLGDINVAGIIASDQAIDLSGANILTTDLAQLSSGAYFAANAGNNINLGGRIISAAAIDLIAGNVIDLNNGKIDPDTGLLVDGIRSQGNFYAQAANGISQSGVVESLADLHFDANIVEISGRTTSLGALAIAGRDIILAASSNVEAIGSISINAAAELSSLGTILTTTPSQALAAELGIATDESGLGNIILSANIIRTAGNILANGDFAATATQNISSAANIDAAGNLQLSGADVLSSGALFSYGALTLTSLGDDLSVNGGVSSTSDIFLDSANKLSIIGDIISAETLSLTADNILIGSALTTFENIKINADSAIQITQSGTLVADQSLSANAISLENAGTISAFGQVDLMSSGRLLTSGKILSNGRLSLRAANFTNSGELNSKLALQVIASDYVQNDAAGVIFGQDNVAINAQNITHAGVLRAENDLNLSAVANLTSLGGGFATAAKNINISSGNNGDLGGLISAEGGTLTITAGQMISGSADLQALDVLSVAANQINLAGDALSFGSLDYTASGNLILGGSNAGIGGLNLSAQQITIADSGKLHSDADIGIVATAGLAALGRVSTLGNVAVNAKDISVADNILAENITLTAAGSIDVAAAQFSVDTGERSGGFIGARGTAKLVANQANIIGDVTGLKNLSIAADAITIGADSRIESNGLVGLAADSLLSAGNLSGFDGVNITTTTSFAKTGGQIGSNGVIAINAGTTFANIGQINTNDALTIAAQSISSDGNLLGEAGVSLTSRTGDIILDGRVDAINSNIAVISAGQLINRAIIVAALDETVGGDVIPPSSVTLSAGSLLDNDGVVFAQDRLAVIAGSLLDNNGSLLTANELTISAPALRHSGIISSASDFALSADKIDLTGDITSAGDISLTATNGALVFGGKLLGANISLKTNVDKLTITNGADIGAFETVNILSGSSAEINGLVNANLLTNIAAAGDISLSNQGQLGSAMDLSIAAGGTFESFGSASASGNLNLSANIIRSGTLLSDAAISVSGQNGVTITGTVDALAAVTLQSIGGSVATSSNASVVSQKMITVNAIDLIDNAGSLGSFGGINLHTLANGQVRSTGNIISEAATNIETGNISLGGTTSAQILSLIATNLTATGLVQSAQDLTGNFNSLTVSETGRLHSSGALTVNAANVVNNNIISSGSTVAINASGSIVNNAGYTIGDDPDALIGIVANGDIHLGAANISGAGDIASAATLIIGGGAVNLGGNINSIGDLTINATSLSLSGSLSSSGNILTTSSGLTAIAGGGVINAKAAENAATGGMVSLTSGTLLTNAGTIAGSRNIGLNAVGDISSTGVIFSNAALAITSGTGDLDLSGQTIGLSDIKLSGRDIDFAGTVASNGNLLVTAGRNLSADGQIAGDDITITAKDGLIGFAATTDLLASGNLMLNAARMNNAGVIAAIGDANIAAKYSAQSGQLANIENDGAILAGGDIIVAADAIALSGGTLNSASYGLIDRQISGRSASLTANQTSIAGSILTSGNINIVGTAANAAVSLASTGIISSSAADIRIDLGNATGSRSFTSEAGSTIFANGNLNIGGVDAATIGGNASALSSLSIDAVGAVNITQAGALATNGNLALTTSAIGNDDRVTVAGGARANNISAITGILDVSGALGASQTMTLVADKASIFGEAASGRDLTLTAADIAVGANGLLYAGRNLGLNGSASINIDGSVGAGSQATITAGQLALTKEAQIFSNGGIVINANNIAPIAGTIQSQGPSGDVAISTGGGLNIATSGKLFAFGGDINLVAAHDITQAGRLQASGLIGLQSTSGNVSINGIVASADRIAVNADHGGLTIGANGILSAAGNPRNIALANSSGAGANIAIMARNAVNNSGAIFTDGSIFAQSQNAAISNSGQITSSGETVLRAENGNFFNGLGAVSAGSLALYQGQDFNNQGTFTAVNNLLVSAPNITNSGLLGANGDLSLISKGILTNSGTIFAGNDLNINAAGALTNDEAVILALGDIRLTSASLLNNSGQIESLGGSMTINTGNLTNQIKTLTIVTDLGDGSDAAYRREIVEENSGAAQIVAAKGLSITAADILNANSSILAGGDLVISANVLNNVGTRLKYTWTSIPLAPIHLCFGGSFEGCGPPKLDPQVVTRISSLPAIIQAGGTLTITANQLGNGSFVDSSSVKGSDKTIPNATVASGSAAAFDTVVKQNAAPVAISVGSASNGAAARNAADQMAQTIAGPAAKMVSSGNITEINGGGAGGDLSVDNLFMSPGENAVTIDDVASTNVNLQGTNGTFTTVAPLILDNTPTGGTLGGPQISEEIAFSVSADPLSAGPSQTTQSFDTSNATMTVSGGDLRDQLIVENQPHKAVSVNGPGDVLSGIGKVDSGTIGDLTSTGPGQSAPAPIVNAAINPGLKEIAPVAISDADIGDNQLGVNSAPLTNAVHAQTAFQSGTLAVPNIFGTDGQIGSFVFNFLDQFNLVDVQKGFDFANGDTLFSYNDAPDSKYLYTTNPGLADTASLFDSDYFFNQLDVDRDTNFLRLGDGFFESLLISRQVSEATKQAQLPKFGSALDQAQGLMQAAAAQQAGLGLSVGTALTAAQIAALDSSIVWYVSSIVNGKNVLVPVVYLAAADRKSLDGNALLAGNNVVLDIKGNIDNPGRIEANNIASLTSGGSIVNRDGGQIAGGLVIANAAQDIINRSANITGGNIIAYAGRDLINDTASINGNDILLQAGRDVTIGATVNVTESSERTDGRKGRFRETNSLTTTVTGSDITAGGSLSIVAGRDLGITASSLQAADNLSLNAGRNIDIGGITANNSQDESWKTGKKHYGESSSSNQIFNGSQIAAGGDLSVEAGGKLAITGSNLLAGGAGRLVGIDGITIGSATETSTATLDERKKRNTDARDFTATTNVLSTVDVGGDLSISSKSDLLVNGAAISAGGALDVTANDITITGVIDQSSETIDSKRVKKGAFSKKTTTTHIESDQQRVVQSTLSGDSVALYSSGDTNILGSNVVGTNDVSLQADGDINIGSLVENNRDLEEVKVKKSGFSVSGGGLFVGKAKASNEDGIKTSNNVGSLIGSSNGNLSIDADGAVKVSASRIIAPGAINLSGQLVTIDNQLDTAETLSKSKSSSFGLSIKLYENVSGAVNSIVGLPDRVVDGAAGGPAQSGITAASETLRSISAVQTLIGDAAGISANLGISKSKSQTESKSEQVAGSLIAGGEINIESGSDISVTGSEIGASGDVRLDAVGDINLRAAQNNLSVDSKYSSSGAGIGGKLGVGIAGTVTAAVSASISSSKGSSHSSETTQTNTKVSAGGTLVLNSGGDTVLAGAVAEGRDVDANVGGNLTIESLQDIARRRSGSSGINVGVTYSPTPGSSGLGANGGLSFSDGRSDSAIVNEQSAIIARGGLLDIDVVGKTDLKGGLLAALDDAGRDSGQLSLATGSLSVSDIKDSARSRDIALGISANVNNPFEKGQRSADIPVVDGSYASTAFEQLTRGTIGAGTVSVGGDSDGSALDGVNRDIDQAQQITKDKQSGFTVYADASALREAVALAKGDVAKSQILGAINKLSEDPLIAFKDAIGELKAIFDDRPFNSAFENLTLRIEYFIGTIDGNDVKEKDTISFHKIIDDTITVLQAERTTAIEEGNSELAAELTVSIAAVEDLRNSDLDKLNSLARIAQLERPSAPHLARVKDILSDDSAYFEISDAASSDLFLDVPSTVEDDMIVVIGRRTRIDGDATIGRIVVDGLGYAKDKLDAIDPFARSLVEKSVSALLTGGTKPFLELAVEQGVGAALVYLPDSILKPVIDSLSAADRLIGDGGSSFLLSKDFTQVRQDNSPSTRRDSSAVSFGVGFLLGAATTTALAVKAKSIYNKRKKGEVHQPPAGDFLAPIDDGKFDYLFGRVSSSPHNAARSQQLRTELARVGVHDTSAGRQIILDHLNDVVKDPSNIIDTFSKKIDGKVLNFETRQSFFSGPGGFLQFNSTFQINTDGTRKLTTIIPKGGN